MDWTCEEHLQHSHVGFVAAIAGLLRSESAASRGMIEVLLMSALE